MLKARSRTLILHNMDEIVSSAAYRPKRYIHGQSNGADPQTDILYQYTRENFAIVWTTRTGNCKMTVNDLLLMISMYPIKEECLLL